MFKYGERSQLFVKLRTERHKPSDFAMQKVRRVEFGMKMLEKSPISKCLPRLDPFQNELRCPQDRNRLRGWRDDVESEGGESEAIKLLQARVALRAKSDPCGAIGKRILLEIHD